MSTEVVLSAIVEAEQANPAARDTLHVLRHRLLPSDFQHVLLPAGAPCFTEHPTSSAS